MKAVVHRRWFHALLLILWIAIGALLRFTQLAAKPPWTDEFATLVFSLGQSFRTVPLDQAISADVLLQPLHLNSQANSLTIVQELLSEDVHPHLYFVLAHQWLRWLVPEDGLVSMWAARSLPALLGVISIPAVFGLSWLAFRSRLVSQITAAIMAVSPFGIFLAQEARHYTLAILWVVASLCCFVVAVQRLDRRSVLSGRLVVVWVGVNALGIATHYFFLLTLVAMALVLLGLAMAQARKDWSMLLQQPWQRIYAVVLGTGAICLLWLPVWHNLRSQEVTQWIQNDDRLNLLSLLNPFFQSLAAWITMLALLPVEADSLAVMLGAGAVMIAFFLWAIPLLRRGLEEQRSQIAQLAVQSLGKFVLGSIALFFLITYGLGSDLTRGARYNFVYFPAVIVLVGASLAFYWRCDSPQSYSLTPPPKLILASESSTSTARVALAISGRTQTKMSPYWQQMCRRGKQAVILVWVMGLLSGITVVVNLGYQKYYRPDLLVPLMQQSDRNSRLIATTHNTLVQVGEMMGIGWELQHHSDVQQPESLFLFAHENTYRCETNCAATRTLQGTLAQLPRPIDVWLINFYAPENLESQRCTLDAQPSTFVSGYSYRLYHCQESGTPEN